MRERKRSRLWLIPGAAAGVIVLVLLVLHLIPTPRPPTLPGARPYLKANTALRHIFVLVMENSSYSDLLGNPDAPWINRAAHTYGLATSYYAVAHPSQPNYLALTSGSTQGVNSDATLTLQVPNLVDQLEAHSHSWKAYMQSLLAGGNTDKLATTAGDYARKHDPFVSYADIQQNPARMARIVDYRQFASDLQANRVPDFAWISPDLCHDMHGRTAQQPGDPCADPHQLVRLGDAFVQTTVDEILRSRAWGGNSLIFLTWDESEANDSSGCCAAEQGGGHILTLVISHRAQAPRTSSTPYNHYALLATIEQGWGLGCLALTCDTVNVHPLNDLLA
ncbi:MAG TPA: alkaline phosphatase family protein [Ktedonobacteraceae bacterium]